MLGPATRGLLDLYSAARDEGSRAVIAAHIMCALAVPALPACPQPACRAFLSLERKGSMTGLHACPATLPAAQCRLQ